MRCEKVAALLPNAAAFDAAVLTLPPWRQRKVEALRFEADRRRSVAAWLLLKEMVGELGIDAAAQTVIENHCGKPAFATAPEIHFSISHAGERVMVVVANAEIGCDVEQIVPIDDEMQELSLSDVERMRLSSFSGAARDKEFIRWWTRKESYLKAIGSGLSCELSTICALNESPSVGWIWRDFDFGDGYLGCVCEKNLV